VIADRGVRNEMVSKLIMIVMILARPRSSTGYLTAGREYSFHKLTNAKYIYIEFRSFSY